MCSLDPAQNSSRYPQVFHGIPLRIYPLGLSPYQVESGTPFERKLNLSSLVDRVSDHALELLSRDNPDARLETNSKGQLLMIIFCLDWL